MNTDRHGFKKILRKRIYIFQTVTEDRGDTSFKLFRKSVFICVPAYGAMIFTFCGGNGVTGLVSTCHAPFCH